MCRSLSPIVVLLLLSAFCAAQEGTWVGAIEADDFFGAVRLDIAKDGKDSKITLYYAGDTRSGPIEELKLTGDEVTFEGKMRPIARFRGKVDRDRISGTFDIINRSGAIQGSGVWDVRRMDAEMPAAAAKPASDINITPQLIKPSGTFKIGRRFFYWTDASRDETITDDKDDKRKLFVQLWYPADPRSKGKPAVYFPNFDALLPTGDEVQAIKSLMPIARTNALFVRSKAKFPLIVFSPGLGSSVFNYTSIIENLVSHGFIVASINHPYDSGPFVFNDGKTVTFSKEKWDRVAPKDWSEEERKKFFDDRRLEWARDASFVVDQLQKQQDVSSRLDFNKLGMLGHSFGGHAVSIVCASDERFNACANLDGLAQGHSFLPDGAGKVMKQPFMFFTKAPEVNDAELVMMGLSREQYQVRERKRLLEKWKPSFRPRMASLASGAYLVVLPGARHSSFSDSPLFETKSERPYSRRVSDARIINEYTLAFFNKFLLNKPAPLLDMAANKDSNVMVEFLKK